MKIVKPSYQDSLLQVANSTRGFLGLELHHASSNVVDEWIEKENIKQLVVFLVDGMGAKQVERCLDKTGFFSTYRDHVMQSVFPSTTVAATTTIRTGLTPAQTRYLGWHQYQPSVNDSVTMFQSCGYYDESKTYPNLIANAYPYQSIVEEANEQGSTCCEIFPFWKGNKNYTIEDICTSTRKALEDHCQYVYSYWDGYDSYMHKHGVYEQGAQTMLQHIEHTIKTMASQLPSYCGLIVLADHGHLDVVEDSLCKYPDLMECFSHYPTLELRCINFYIKPEWKIEFAKRFNQYFAQDFQLYSRDEVVSEKLFGNFDSAPTWIEELGDYIAVAISNKILTCGENIDIELKGYHAGMCEDEMEIPLILYPKKSNRRT